MDSRCGTCTEPIDRTKPHVVVTRCVERRLPDMTAEVADDVLVAEYHRGAECAPSAEDIRQAVLGV